MTHRCLVMNVLQAGSWQLMAQDVKVNWPPAPYIPTHKSVLSLRLKTSRIQDLHISKYTVAVTWLTCRQCAICSAAVLTSQDVWLTHTQSRICTTCNAFDICLVTVRPHIADAYASAMYIWCGGKQTNWRRLYYRCLACPTVHITMISGCIKFHKTEQDMCYCAKPTSVVC